MFSTWGVKLGEMPRVYIATVEQIAKELKDGRNGRGNTMLLENYNYKKGVAKGLTDAIPQNWIVTQERINFLLEGAG